MMRGIIWKAVCETWLSTLLCGVGLFAVMALLTQVLPQIVTGMSEIFEQLPFVRSLVTALMGTDAGDEITARTMQAFLWVHPVVLALIWGHEITLCTRVPAGEIDRGTIDVMLSWPVSRRRIYLSETYLWLASGFTLIVMGYLGHRSLAGSMPESMRPDWQRTMLIMANLFGVYLAVGGVALLVSAVSDRRGRAIAFVFTVVLASFLLNFLGQFWAPARKIAFLSIMQYYQPAQILSSGAVPWGNFAVLLMIAALTWLCGCEIFARRNIRTV